MPRPWFASEVGPVSEAQVHGQTGALNLHGIKIRDLDGPSCSKTISKDGFMLFRLENIFITGPPNVQTGDSVFFLQGLNQPTVLRPQIRCREDIFTFVGLCYVRI